MNESTFQKNLIAALKKRNARVVNFAGTKYQERGISDLRITHRYWQGWSELKVREKRHKVSPEQAAFLFDHAERGDNCIVVWYEPDGSITVQSYREDRSVVDFKCDDLHQFVGFLLRRR